MNIQLELISLAAPMQIELKIDGDTYFYRHRHGSARIDCNGFTIWTRDSDNMTVEEAILKLIEVAPIATKLVIESEKKFNDEYSRSY